MNTDKYLLSLPPKLKSRLIEQAQEKGLTLASYMRMVLTERARLGTRLINDKAEIQDLVSKIQGK